MIKCVCVTLDNWTNASLLIAGIRLKICIHYALSSTVHLMISYEFPIIRCILVCQGRSMESVSHLIVPVECYANLNTDSINYVIKWIFMQNPSMGIGMYGLPKTTATL